MAEGPFLPLFPLPLVLFPQAPLPLHIFEPRYRRMVGDAARDHSEFGVILLSEKQLGDAGCTAVVERIVKRYDDGRFDVEARGQRRYRTLALDDSEPCLRARVEFFDDEDSDPPPEKLVRNVAKLAQKAARLTRTAVPEVGASGRPSFAIAQSLPLDLAFKQKLLIDRSEKARLASLEVEIRRLLRRYEQASRTQQLAGSNGHARPV